jgi:hypothetical protein
MAWGELMQGLAGLADRARLGGPLGLGLPLLELGHHLLEELRILQEVLADDVADRLLLRLAERGGLGGGRGQGRGARNAAAATVRRRVKRIGNPSGGADQLEPGGR